VGSEELVAMWLTARIPYDHLAGIRLLHNRDKAFFFLKFRYRYARTEFVIEHLFAREENRIFQKNSLIFIVNLVMKKNHLILKGSLIRFFLYNIGKHDCRHKDQYKTPVHCN
jgi:hypothetical protein